MPATQILVFGSQGSGKSSAWENVPPSQTIIITPNIKPLPWGGSAKQYTIGVNRVHTREIVHIPTLLEKISKEYPHVNYVLIEDLTHFFNARTTDQKFIDRKMGNDAYAKWNELGADVLRAIDKKVETLRDDLFIVYHGHEDINDQGEVVLQTPGKLLDNTVKVPSYFTYVLHTLARKTDKGIEYVYLTNKDGIHDAKTPKGCFNELYIPNDIMKVFERIKEYQG